MGNEEYIYLDINSKRIIVIVKSENIPKINDKVKFTFEEEDIHLFDINSKKSLKI